MKDIEYEKEKAKEMLNLIEEYTNTQEKSEANKKLNQISDELYYQKRDQLSQQMIDVALAVHSFTQASLEGGHFQDLEEFVSDLKGIIGD